MQFEGILQDGFELVGTLPVSKYISIVASRPVQLVFQSTRLRLLNYSKQEQKTFTSGGILLEVCQSTFMVSISARSSGISKPGFHSQHLILHYRPRQ